MKFKNLGIKSIILFLAFLLIYSCNTGQVSKAEGRVTKSFDFSWRFQMGELDEAKNPDYNDKGWEMINLPHDWSIERPFSARWASGTGYLPGGVGWYRKEFTIPEKYSNKKIFVQFDGIYKRSKVWINGELLGFRPYGYISFQYELTPHLNFGGEKNVMAIRVDHRDFADSRWYAGSGIYRHVWLKIMDKLHIAHWGNYVTTPRVSENSAEVQIETKVKNESTSSKSCTVVNTILDAEGKAQKTIEREHKIPGNDEYNFVQKTSIDNPNLWSHDNPYLYKVVTEVKSNNQIVDNKKTNLGLRYFRFSADSGFFLNGENMLLKGTCLHHDLGPFGAALNDRALEKRIKMLKEMGCNAIRTSHNPPSPQLLEYCDKYGMLVMDEAFDEWARGKKKWIQGWNVGQEKGMAGKGKYFSLDGYNKYFEEWSETDIKAMVKRDKNHPSIIMWSIGNEIDYPGDPYSYDEGRPSPEELVPIAKKLVAAVKEVDTTRPVTAALANLPVSNKTGLAQQLDIVGYNYQEDQYEKDHKAFPNRLMLGSENGDSDEAWLAVKDNPYISSQFLWTGVDYLGEAGRFPNRSSGSGMIDLATFKKPLYYYRKSLWSEDPTVFIATKKSEERGWPQSHWNYSDAEGQEIEVTCYTNCDEVELFLNDKSLGIKERTKDSGPSLSWQVPYQKGALRVVGKEDGESVTTHKLQTAGEPAKLKMYTDREAITADGQDIVYVKVKVLDENGVKVPHADNRIVFNLTGSGKIRAVGNSDHSCLQSYQVNYRNAYKGRCAAIVQSIFEPGEINIAANSEGLEADSLVITSTK
ncbi:MAG: DUF4982 domain-containing protein [Candidatus Marinimicrobia bacterium]|nr:DUF4982 domain-containing protein [Candidatus Neomarinimicrobiota bacterium]